MIYSYQIVSKPLTTQTLHDEQCPICSKKGGIQVTLYMRYARTIIPIVGLGRTTGVICSLCGHVLKEPNTTIFKKRGYSPAIDAALQNIRAHKRTLWQRLYPWSFFLAIFAFFLCALVRVPFTKHKQNNLVQLIENPMPGDIYKSTWLRRTSSATVSDGVLLKLVRIQGDTMFVVKSKNAIENWGYTQKVWDALSENDNDFDPTEYKISLSRFSRKKGGDFGRFLEFNTEPIDFIKFNLKGGLIDNGGMDIEISSVERKK
ncbi:MAG: hypothetical protein J0I41_10960 [Filimonas sp.]|nr:hypothetical protein [Filimonas sp.]